MEPDTTFEKLDDNTLQMTVTPPAPEPVVTVYTIDELTKNRDNLVASIADLQTQLDDCETLIVKATNLGITSNQEIQL